MEFTPLEQECFCGICTNLMHEGRELSCKHSFCTLCLRNVPISFGKPTSSISCPICFRNTPVSVGILSLPRTNHLDDIIHQLKKSHRFHQIHSKNCTNNISSESCDNESFVLEDGNEICYSSCQNDSIEELPVNKMSNYNLLPDIEPILKNIKLRLVELKTLQVRVRNTRMRKFIFLLFKRRFWIELLQWKNRNQQLQNNILTVFGIVVYCYYVKNIRVNNGLPVTF